MLDKDEDKDGPSFDLGEKNRLKHVHLVLFFIVKKTLTSLYCRKG